MTPPRDRRFDDIRDLAIASAARLDGLQRELDRGFAQIEKDTENARRGYPDKDETARQLRELEQAASSKAREEAERVGEATNQALNSFRNEVQANIAATAVASEKQNEGIVRSLGQLRAETFDKIETVRGEVLGKIEDATTRQTVVSVLSAIGLLAGLAAIVSRFAGV